MEHDYAAVMAHNHTSMLVHTFTSCRMDNFKNVSFSPTASILVSVQQRSNACLPHQGIRRAQLYHSTENTLKVCSLLFSEICLVYQGFHYCLFDIFVHSTA